MNEELEGYARKKREPNRDTGEMEIKKLLREIRYLLEYHSKEDDDRAIAVGFIDGLRSKVADLKAENAQLKEENKRLKAQNETALHMSGELSRLNEKLESERDEALTKYKKVMEWLYTGRGLAFFEKVIFEDGEAPEDIDKDATVL